METKSENTIHQTLGLLLVLAVAFLYLVNLSLPLSAKDSSSTTISNLRVQSAEIPLAVEDKNPVFSWQMISTSIGQKQSAYQIVVTKKNDKSVVWDSGKVDSDLSNEIRYNGNSLQPESAYAWKLTVWDVKGKTYTKASRFETGLMNPKIEAWDGAKWIGTNQLTLDAASACLFEIKTDFQIKKGGKAVSIIFGANDFRFNDSFQNIENVKGENYIRFELDVSGVGTKKGAVLNIYRVGYGKNDSPTVPYKIASTEQYPDTNLNEIITAANVNDVHNMDIIVNTGEITFKIDGKALILTKSSGGRRGFGPPGGGEGGSPDEGFGPPEGGGGGAPDEGFEPPEGGFGPPGRGGASLSISNYSTGNNFNTYPNLNSVGFASNPGDEVAFSNYTILNVGQSSSSNNIVFDSKTGSTYSIFKKLPGITVSEAGDKITVKNDTNKTRIGYVDPSYGSLTMLRTIFSTKSGKKIAGAKMYATAMGAYEMYINGRRMGKDWFTPGDSQFRETLCYHAYDVTDMIIKGSNSIGAILNSGWYTGYMTFSPDNFNFFGDTEAFLAKLVITYTDGTKDIVVSDPDTWKLYKNGPIEYGSFFQGERYNAKKNANISVKGNLSGWSTAEYNDSQWKKAEIVKQRDWVKFDLVARYDQPVRVAQVIQAQKVLDTHSEDSHTYTYDMGINLVGVPAITIPAGWLRDGDVVIMRYGEQVYPGFSGDSQDYIDLYGYSGKGKGVAGRILTETYRAAFATDFYTAAGNGEAVIQPTTTYRGYQYIQITVPDHAGPLALQNVKGIVLSSNSMPSGTYEAATADGAITRYVNQLFKNIQRSQLGNFFTIPTDCPQRNERMGWTGDAQAYSRTATYNADVQNFFRQWMVALRNDQSTTGGIGSTVPTYTKADDKSFADGTTWAGAVCMVPWQLYTQYGDKQIVAENMGAMKAWLDGMDRYDFSKEYPHLSSKASGLADWLAVDGSTPSDMVNNAIYIYLMEATSVMAKAIGEDAYAVELQNRHNLAKTEWNKLYVDPETGKTRTSKGKLVHSQTSYATPLNFNAFSNENLKKAQGYLAELAANPSASGAGKKTYPRYSITTGFSGTPNILPSLSRSGHVKEAYNMFTCAEYASWLYPVTKGATSVWERWNGYELAFQKGGENSMNSFNHFALGAVGQWMYEFQLGITNDHAKGEAGYKHFVLQPTTGEKFTSLKGSFNSNYGVISSSWAADGNGNMTSYTAVVPANTTATLYLPVNEASEKFAAIKGASFVKRTTRNNIAFAEYELSSGSFSFTITGNGVTVRATREE